MFSRRKSTILIIILALILIAGGVWYTQKPAPATPPVVSGKGEQVVDKTKNPLGNDKVDLGDNNYMTEVIKVDEFNYKSGDWMIYKNTRFGYQIALPAGFTDHDEYYGIETEFSADGYGFNAWKGKIGVVSSGDKRFVLYQGNKTLTDNWLRDDKDIEFYQIGINKFRKVMPLEKQETFSTANDTSYVWFSFTNIDSKLKAQILNSFEFTE